MEIAAKYKTNIEIAFDEENLAHRAVDCFTGRAKSAINTKGVFCVAVSGGHTPKRFFELLGEIPQSKALQWHKIHLFWVDERIVRSDSQWSNYKLAADTFLNKVAIPEKNIHRIPTEGEDFKAAANRYEQTIRKVFSLEEKQLPKFDLIVLGMGEDGHTGSLFPNCYASFDTDDLACVVYVLDDKLNRITLTHPVLCEASSIVVLVSGDEKAEILKRVLTSEPDEVQYPIHSLWPALDKIIWIVDNKAAKLL